MTYTEHVSDTPSNPPTDPDAPCDFPADPMAAIAADPARPLPAREGPEAEQARAFAIAAARTLADSRCTDVLVFDVRRLSQVTDYLIIASGTSDRQMSSAARDAGDVAREMGMQRYGGEADEQTLWLVQDYVTVMIHLFEPLTRAHYDLEMMWGDADVVTWQRDGSAA